MSILVTGDQGFIGQHLVAALEDAGEIVVGASEHSCDLLNEQDVNALFKYLGPFNRVFHLAGYNGGISFNKTHPFEIFSINTKMALNVMDACLEFDTSKIISMISSCAYPDLNGDLLEDEFLHGEPHDSVACHAYAKRNVLLAGDFLGKMPYCEDTKCVAMCPPTVYGPGDRLDHRGKFVSQLTQKFVEAVMHDEPEVVCLGTGNVTREVLFVDDAVDLIMWAADLYEDSSKPLNIGFGQAVTVKQVAEALKKITGFSGKIVWNTSFPDGQRSKVLDTRGMMALGSCPVVPTSIEYGLRETVQDVRKRLLGGEA